MGKRRPRALLPATAIRRRRTWAGWRRRDRDFGGDRSGRPSVVAGWPAATVPRRSHVRVRPEAALLMPGWLAPQLAGGCGDAFTARDDRNIRALIIGAIWSASWEKSLLLLPDYWGKACFCPLPRWNDQNFPLDFGLFLVETIRTFLLILGCSDWCHFQPYHSFYKVVKKNYV